MDAGCQMVVVGSVHRGVKRDVHVHDPGTAGPHEITFIVDLAQLFSLVLADMLLTHSIRVVP